MIIRHRIHSEIELSSHFDDYLFLQLRKTTGFPKPGMGKSAPSPVSHSLFP